MLLIGDAALGDAHDLVKFAIGLGVCLTLVPIWVLLFKQAPPMMKAPRRATATLMTRCGASPATMGILPVTMQDSGTASATRQVTL